MGRAGRLAQPALPHRSAHKELNVALHRLHLLAKSPSLSQMAKDLMHVPGASRTTIYNAFSSQRLPMAGLIDAVVVYLAERVRNVTPESVEQVAWSFDGLWYLAEEEARYDFSPPVSPDPRDAAQVPDTSVVVVREDPPQVTDISVVVVREDLPKPRQQVGPARTLPALLPPEQLLGLRPPELRTRLDAMRKHLTDEQTVAAVVSSLTMALGGLLG